MHIRKLLSMSVVFLFVFGAFASRAVASSEDNSVPERVDVCEAKMSVYVSRDSLGYNRLDFEGFKKTLSPYLAAELKRGARSSNKDIQAILYLKESVKAGNEYMGPQKPGGMEAASLENAKLWGGSCFHPEIRLHKIQVELHDQCAQYVLGLMRACQVLPKPFNKLGGDKVCKLVDKATEIMNTCGKGGFTLKLYFFRLKFDVGCP